MMVCRFPLRARCAEYTGCAYSKCMIRSACNKSSTVSNNGTISTVISSRNQPPSTNKANTSIRSCALLHWLMMYRLAPGSPFPCWMVRIAEKVSSVSLAISSATPDGRGCDKPESASSFASRESDG